MKYLIEEETHTAIEYKAMNQLQNQILQIAAIQGYWIDVVYILSHTAQQRLRYIFD